jgi:hypothetical protein
MASVSLTGQDVVQINNTVLTGLADENPGVLSYPNDLAAVKSAKNGNVIYALNNQGLVAKLALRIVLGSSDDKMLDALRQSMINNFSFFSLLTCNFTKRVGDGQGNVNSVVYICNGGVFDKIPGTETSASGDTSQSVAMYSITFGNGTRTIQ